MTFGNSACHELEFDLHLNFHTDFRRAAEPKERIAQGLERRQHMGPEVHLEPIPRPPGHLLVGNLLDIDAAHPIESLAELAREYGPHL